MKTNHFRGTALCMALLIAASTANSQEFIDRPDKTAFSLGVVGSVNASTFSSSDPSLNPSFGFRIGGQVGVAANLRFGLRSINSSAQDGKYGLQAEATYSMMGANIDSDGGIGLGYLSVPVLFQFYPTPQFYLEVGPQFCLNLTHTPEHTAFDTHNLDLGNLKANDVAATLGIGLARQQIHVGVRYVMGMSDLATNLAWRNQCVQVHLTYLFNMGHSGSVSTTKSASKQIIAQPAQDDFDF